ncbi:MAG: peptidylprolyl isomerase, partial [Planctomycetia bacterium]|nr:peptidylprolyl isomerase [Planctomycetia bacterium]
ERAKNPDAEETDTAESVEKPGSASDFLFTYLQIACQGDDYEVAYELAKLLISIDYQGDWFPAFAGYAAFCVNDFDMAETQLKKAQEHKWLTPREPDDLIARARRALVDQQPDGSVHSLADSRKSWEAEAAIRAAEQAAGEADPERALPRVKLDTSKGELVIELFEEQAPIAVANFLTLVENGFYTDVPFHRVLPGFMAQGGDPTGTGTGGPGYVIRSEFTRPDARKHFRGTLSMARTAQPDTEGSQFFLCFVPARFLDGNYTAFGRVVEGMDVLAKIQKIDPESPDPTVVPDTIRKAEVLRKRNHPYTFEKLRDR